ncbi:MAG TPA: DUF1761 domain-containing protein [Candidatus Baltobacteraceae bacterium]|nr:DUF1761 domain-containing protein [Candidatus Baltobacteraceae bacterium]
MRSRINHSAVFVSAVAFFVLGWLWYDALFGRLWMSLTGHTGTASAASMMPQFIASFVLGWILAYVIAIALDETADPNPARHGIAFGVFMGLGVFGTMLGVMYIYEGRPFALWGINAGYVVVGMAIMGAIIGAWRKSAVAAAA